MEIDWVTVSAQIANFLILVWLLKRFLYRPVIRAMDRREQRISERLNEAQQREALADEKAQHFQEKSDELARRHDEILEQTWEQAEQEKRALLDQARAEVADTREQWLSQAGQEKEEFLGNLRRQAVDAIQAIARKALAELADASLEERMVDRFIERLGMLDEDARKALANAPGPVRIAAAFELDTSVRERLLDALHEQIAEGLEVDFSCVPELLCGIDLTRGGQQLSWNLADFTEELGSRIDEAFSPTDPVKDKE